MNSTLYSPKAAAQPVMELSNLRKSYGSLEVLHGLDFQLEPGEICGLIGPNGAGKTTTIRCILGLIRPNAGTLGLFGQTIAWTDVGHRRRIGYMPGDPSFPDAMTVQEVLQLSASLYHIKDTTRQQELLRRLQLDPKKKVRELSLGNQKKLAVITALQHDPDLLILDEPTSGLDPLMQREFFAILQEYARRGCSILLSSHNLWEVEAYCSRMVCLQDGRIIWSTTRDDFQAHHAWTVTCTFASSPVEDQTARLGALEGVSSLKIHPVLASGQLEVTFLYQGPLHRLLTALSACELQDLILTKPDLEQQMIGLYRPPAGNSADQTLSKGAGV